MPCDTKTSWLKEFKNKMVCAVIHTDNYSYVKELWMLLTYIEVFFIIIF